MNRFFILAIESSCDNSSLCLMNSNKDVIFYKNFNQESMMASYGGFVPKLMVDVHIDTFCNIITEFCSISYIKIDYIAICCGPGMIMSLNIGYAVAHAFALFFNAKLIYIDHIEAHIWSHSIDVNIDSNLPFLSIVASGGHCIISHISAFDKMKIIAQTVDDAPGEVFDKIAVKLSLIPSTGQGVDNAARRGLKIDSLINIDRSKFRQISKYYHMSFSGLKTRFKNFINHHLCNIEVLKSDICYSLEYSIYQEIKIAIKYALKHIKYDVSYFALAGGVLANTYIRHKIYEDFKDYKIHLVNIKYAQDNAIMIANMAILSILHGLDHSPLCYSRIPYNIFYYNNI